MGSSSCCSLPVLLVVTAILLNYASLLFLFIRPWLGLLSAAGLLHIGLFTCINVMLLVSYALAAARDPGHVPSNFLPDLETSHQNSAPKGKEKRFCDKCNQSKPPRAHHCRQCKRCVLRMDHHCVWMNNCIGHKNYKAFILVVLYSCMVCLYSTVLILGYHAFHSEQAHDAGHIRVLHAFVMLVASAVSASWLVWNALLLLQNKTTIEYHEAKRERWIADKAGQIYRHPYDLGPLANFISVLGPKTSYWLCPMSVGHIGSGLWSRTCSEHHLAAAAAGEQG